MSEYFYAIKSTRHQPSCLYQVGYSRVLYLTYTMVTGRGQLSGPLTEEYVGVVVGALVGSFMYCVISRKTHYLICYFPFIETPVLPPVFMKGLSIVHR